MTQKSRFALAAILTMIAMTTALTGCAEYKLAKPTLHEQWHWPFVPLNTVDEQATSCGQCVVEPPCFGYHATCWHRWPEGCGECPDEATGCREEVIEEYIVPAAEGGSVQPNETAKPTAGDNTESALKQVPDSPAPAKVKPVPAPEPKPLPVAPVPPQAPPAAAKPAPAPKSVPAMPIIPAQPSEPAKPAPAPTAVPAAPPTPVPPAAKPPVAVPPAAAPAKEPAATDSTQFGSGLGFGDMFQVPVATPPQEVTNPYAPLDSDEQEPVEQAAPVGDESMDWMGANYHTKPLASRLHLSFVGQQRTAAPSVQARVMPPAAKATVKPATVDYLGSFIDAAAPKQLEAKPVSTSTSPTKSVAPSRSSNKVRVHFGDASE